MERRTHTTGAMLLCILLSVLLHGFALLWLADAFTVPIRGSAGGGARAAAPAPRLVRVVRQQVRPTIPERIAPPKMPAPFAKTSADSPQERPDRSDYIGARNTRAASDPHAYQKTSEQEAPTLDGVEKEELVTFDQERQDGSLEHEGKNTPGSSLPSPKSQTEPVPPTPLVQLGTEAGSATAPEMQGDSPQDLQEKGILNAESLQEGGAFRHQENMNLPLGEQDGAAARKGQQDGTQRPISRSLSAHSPARRIPLYDPSLAQGTEAPGFRTTERRSRSSGRFVLGRGAALNVSSTPRGQYEALIYRSIAHHWYIACDQHRGDIIPGKINISLRINRKGHLVNMQLLHRRGASISQQSFTFKAIRKAALPPMPPAVQNEVVGELMELIFEFNFD